MAKLSHINMIININKGIQLKKKLLTLSLLGTTLVNAQVFQASTLKGVR